jgi:hypothetical protein
MVQSKDKRIHEVPDRGSMATANEAGSEASQAFGNDDIGEYDSFFEALEVAAPNGIESITFLLLSKYNFQEKDKFFIGDCSCERVLQIVGFLTCFSYLLLLEYSVMQISA